MKRLFTAMSLVCAALLAGCGSATDNVDFNVPSGFQSKMNMFGMETWTRGEDPNTSAIVLMRLPVKVDINKFQSPDLSSSGMKNTKVESSQVTTICDGQPAAVIKAQATGEKSNKDMDLNMVATEVGGTSYMAMYVHPHGEPADMQAVSAIMHVCAKK